MLDGLSSNVHGFPHVSLIVCVLCVATFVETLWQSLCLVLLLFSPFVVHVVCVLSVFP